MSIPVGTSIREIARSGRAASEHSDYRWHSFPDGGATFAQADGGWIYVSNSEVRDEGAGGVGALQFDTSGELKDSYAICSGTTANCAGGPTPWGTWLTCEEFEHGQVYECDPLGQEPAALRAALGRFRHEAAAVDADNKQLYLTEDEPDGCLYRFTPASWDAGRPDLSYGTLAVAILHGDGAIKTVEWRAIPDPQALKVPTRKQIDSPARFDGGEGIWFHEGQVYFATKGDNRVWRYDTNANQLHIHYERGNLDPAMADVDNLVVADNGEVVVAEDGPMMRLVVVDDDMHAAALVEFEGHRRSEICGPAFSPDGDRLYFSSQRGPSGSGLDGRTYELRGLNSL